MPCCLLLAVLLASVAQVVDPGFTKLQGDNTCSEEVLTFICVTAGRGATEVTLNNATVQDLEFSHSRYETGSAVNQSSGDVSAGSLSRSQTQDCFDELTNTSSYCYETVIKVRLTEQTRCRTIGCRTRFRLDGVDRLVYFGDAAVAREPPAPKNIRNTTQPAGAVTITWDPESGSCSNARYSVRTSNCGSCDDRSNSTQYTNITCSELVPEQQCHVSVQSILECGAPSDPATLMFKVSAVSPPEASTEGMVNVGAIVGGVIGSFFVILGVIILIIGIIVWRRRQGHADLHGIKRSDSEGAPEDTSTTASPDQGAKQEKEVAQGHEDPPNQINDSIAEDTTIDNRADQQLLSSPIKNAQSHSTETAAVLVPGAMPLHQISSSGSTEETAADDNKTPSIETESNLQNEDAKTYTPQSSAESRMVVAEESGTGVDLKTDKYVAISQPKTLHNGAPRLRVDVEMAVEDSSLPSSSTTRGMEPLQLGLPPIFESFNGTVGDDREFGDAREITSGAETVWSQDPPKKPYGLSDGGKILTTTEPTTPVPPSNGEVQSSQTVAGTSQFSYVAPPESNQLTDIIKRVGDLEVDREEQTQKIKNLETSREKQTQEINDLKTSQDEHTQAIEKSNLKIEKLLAEARKNELTMGKLTQRIEQLTKDLEAKERKHQEELDMLEQEHLTEKEKLKQEIENSRTEMQDLRKELEGERTKVLNLEAESQKLREELEQERRKANNLEKMARSRAVHSLDKKDSKPGFFSYPSCPV